MCDLLRECLEIRYGLRRIFIWLGAGSCWLNQQSKNFLPDLISCSDKLFLKISPPYSQTHIRLKRHCYANETPPLPTFPPPLPWSETVLVRLIPPPPLPNPILPYMTEFSYPFSCIYTQMKVEDLGPNQVHDGVGMWFSYNLLPLRD